MEWCKAAKREEWHIGDALGRKFLDQGIIVAMGQIVVVLHAYDFGNPAPFRELDGCHVAQAEMTDQAFLLQFGERGERRFN